MRITRKGIAAFILAAALPAAAFGADADLQKKIDDLSRQLEALKQQVQKNEEKAKTTEEKVEKTEALAKETEEKSLGRWLSIGGDYRFRVDSLRGNVHSYYQYNGTPNPTFVPGFSPANDTLFTNRFGLNLKAKALENVTVKARLLMYKVSGAQNDTAIIGPYATDRMGIFDGTLGHVPSDGQLTVDQAYVTWSNIADQPVWFSVGRRPSTEGSPSHLRQNKEKTGTAGIPAILVDYAFDGMTLGYAPEIDMLGSPYIKLCYGRGFESGYTVTGLQNNGLSDTDMLGVQITPYSTDNLTAIIQWNRAFNVFNTPAFVTGPTLASGSPYSGFAYPSVNLGDIDWIGTDIVGKVGSLNWFVDGALSFTHPNNNTAMPGMPIGLMYTGQRTGKNGWSVYLGGRYDFESTGTKIGLEYNHGSRDWITFAPAADDIWTSKLGTRGDVLETYLIQEIKLKPISNILSKVFFKVGFQYYWFNASGSNNWVGGPANTSDLALSPAYQQMMAPLETAQDIYGTFEVHF